MGATRSRRTSTCADFLISATSSASPTGSTRRCGTCLPATPSRPGSERVRRGTPLTYLVTAAGLAVSGLLGVWGFRGSPLLDPAVGPTDRRSDEGRVGEECGGTLGCRWDPEHYKKNKRIKLA